MLAISSEIRASRDDYHYTQKDHRTILYPKGSKIEKIQDRPPGL